MKNMGTVQTYSGVVREGRIRLTPSTELPEGSQLYITVVGQEPILDKHTAQRKATRWLVEYVGNMLVADGGRLQEVNGRIVWRYDAFVTGRGHKPRGPIGYVDIDAHSGEPLATEQQADEMIKHGVEFVRSLPQTIGEE
jgi:hypothetical protein